MDTSLVVFDEECQIRIYGPELYDEAQDLQSQAQQFIEKLHTFRETISNHMSVVQAAGQKIENEKLRAIGMRNKVDGEAEARKRRQRELQQHIKEKQIELDRYVAEWTSLTKVEQEQKALIEQLSFAE
eukprot:TRINITY_DN107506_c0_g1_i1.p1 TRINITY_DN107506_c0_g1~~TRINITY_DN107506_c0_g1_i1.p1  ORF type:complete len:128 (+),score=9.32 TRINITY_DN107506_c0_g1_i1:34-417(+)